MNSLRFYSIGACLVCLVCGCSSHYYRSNGNGMTLYLRQPEAERVVLFYSLDGFSPHAVEKKGSAWVANLPSNREFRYFYEVDGEVFTPSCRIKEKDDFGFENCVFIPEL